MLHSSEPVQVDRGPIVSFGQFAVMAPRFAPPIGGVPIPEAAPGARPRVTSAPQPRRRSRAPLPDWRLRRVKQHVAANIEATVTLADMAGAAGLSPMHFAAQFRVATGLRPHEFLLRCRIDHAQRLLAEPRAKLADVAFSVGFQTQAHFTTVFKRLVGETPHRWRQRVGTDGDLAGPVTEPVVSRAITGWDNFPVYAARAA